jgi:hypothetical protein
MTMVFAWPPVRTVAAMWTTQTPVRRSASAVDGTRFVSSAGPSRIRASLVVPALAGRRDGAGYCEALKHLLDGGINLVRVPSPPANWHLDDIASVLRSAPFGWLEGDDDAPWSVPVQWFTGPAIRGEPVDIGGVPHLALSGIPPVDVVVRAWDVIRVYPAGGGASVTARALRTVDRASDGTALVPLTAVLPAGVASLQDQEARVFEVTAMPEAPQPLGQNWVYEWPLLEVLPYQIPAGAVEVDPWR